MKKNMIIRLSNLSFSYPNGKRLFDGISFDFYPGEFYLIQGASGAGKSTLLRLINRLEEATDGEITYHGKPLTDYHAPLLRKKISYIQQTPAVIRGTIKENLLLPFTFHGNRDQHKPDDETLSRQLQSFHLHGIDLNQPVENLSVGQLQRICLIRGLLLSPEVILLDEPTSALDDDSAMVVESKAESFCQTHQATVLMVSHRLFTPTMMKPRKIKMEEGKIREIT
ncbi:MAG: ABC transporter ATP-binding protein [Pseudomonadota bacterium]